MMMKKVLIILLALALLISGCTRRSAQETTPGQSGSALPEETDGQTETGEQTEAAGQAETGEQTEPAEETQAVEEKDIFDLTSLPEDNYRNYYEIFVYSFYDSDGDGIGDLNGVREKLDYIEEMGFSGIWLMPIMPSPTYHKYDVKDYMAVDEAYGTEEDYKALVEDAHSRGIRVIIDLPINHTSSSHPWFREARKYLQGLSGEEADAKDCPYFGYYHFSEEYGGSTWYPVPGTDWYYEGSFWSEMPDLDLSCEALRKDLEEAADFWIGLGTDGFRMDAPLHFEENNASFNKETLNWFFTFCRSKNPDFYMVSEVWAGLNTIKAYYASGTPSMFNFDAAQAEGKLMQAARGTMKAERFANLMVQYENDFSEENPDYIDAPFLTNHDMGRVANALNNKDDQMRRAAGYLMLMSGNPFVYYGEEIGMASSGTKDENKRLPMLWDSDPSAEGLTDGPKDADDGIESKFGSVREQLQDEDSLLKYYQRALRMRNENPEIARGRTEILGSLTSRDTAAFKRSYDGNTAAVVFTTAKTPTEVDLKGSEIENWELVYALTLHADEAVTQEGSLVTLPAGGIAVFREMSGTSNP